MSNIVRNARSIIKATDRERHAITCYRERYPELARLSDEQLLQYAITKQSFAQHAVAAVELDCMGEIPAVDMAAAYKRLDPSITAPGPVTIFKGGKNE